MPPPIAIAERRALIEVQPRAIERIPHLLEQLAVPLRNLGEHRGDGHDGFT
jgi:hypothetical protein